MILKKNLFPLLVLFLSSLSAFSQASLVPANHQVYEFLHHQRVMGNAPNFEYESIPISRGRIEKHLNGILEDSTIRLSKIDKQQLNAYLREFSVGNLKKQSSRTLLQGRKTGLKNTLVDKADLFLGQEEFHIYTHVDSISNANVDIWWGQGFIKNTDKRQNNLSAKGGYNFLGLRTYGSLYGKIGYHLDYQNVSSLSGEQNLTAHPVWGDTWHIKTKKTSTFYAQAFASANFGKLSFDIGRGMLQYGVGHDPMIASREAPDFDWLRLTWKSKYVNYDYIHGLLQSFGTQISDLSVGNQTFKHRLRIERWFVMRRLTLKPTNWIQLAYSQTTIYSDRGVDFSHLNPILPAEVAELNNQDLDNPSLYLDLVVRPLKSIELFGTISADDINKKSDIFRKTGNRSSEDGVFAYNAGINFSYRTGTDISIQYSQLDPFYYTHRFRFNTYENLGKSIGSQLSPNSDEARYSLRQWLPRRSWVMASFKQVRQGFNIINDSDPSAPVLLEDVGGDLFEPQTSGDIVRFLAGDVNKWQELSLSGHLEPSRTIRLNFIFSKVMSKQGLRVSNGDYIEFGISLGY